MFFRDYYFSSGNSRVNRLIALFRCIVGLMKQIAISVDLPQSCDLHMIDGHLINICMVKTLKKNTRD